MQRIEFRGKAIPRSIQLLKTVVKQIEEAHCNNNPQLVFKHIQKLTKVSPVHPLVKSILTGEQVIANPNDANIMAKIFFAILYKDDDQPIMDFEWPKIR